VQLAGQKWKKLHFIVYIRCNLSAVVNVLRVTTQLRSSSIRATRKHTKQALNKR